MKQRIGVLSALFLLVMRAGLPAESGVSQKTISKTVVSYDFTSRDIGEILFAVSQYEGFPVTADDTVFGTADFRCAGEDFDTAFESFLKKNRLYVTKTETQWTVSKIFIQRRNDEFSVDAMDVSPERIFERVGTECGICIVGENLPQVKQSVHTGFCSEHELVHRLALLCAGFEAVAEKTGFYRIVRVGSGQTIGANQTAGRADFTLNDDGTFLCDVQNAPLGFALEKLCKLAEKRFCIVSGGEGKIVRADFDGKHFFDTLTVLCLQGGAEAVLHDGVYYVFASKNAREKMTGAGKEWKWLKLSHRKPQEFISLAAKRFPGTELIAVNEQGDVLYRADEAEQAEMAAFALNTDVALPVHLVQLQFLRTADFMAHLPPFVEKSQITDSGHGDSFYFMGSETVYQRLLKELKVLDKPVARISYDLLIMQYQKSKETDWSAHLSANRLKLGDMNTASAVLGSVMDLSLDVVGVFGLHFAAELQAAINDSKARVFADTTLNGVSGSTISFQNTNTYRYRDNNLDPETGKPVYSGITKEIASGLKLEVTGTVTGDGMITSKITASMSRQGTDTSSTTGNPPPTSEKVITTEVRARSGEPVVLSGLIQNEEIESESRVPFLSKIPLLGLLFKAKNTSAEKTELVIYLVPSSESGFKKTEKETADFEKQEMMRLYKEFVL
ncbi:MAG: type II and III secretion system protein [Treponema sp.]|nr:type II and III secretion system protein [Treponema sp.]